MTGSGEGASPPPYPLDHVGVAVESIDASRALFEELGGGAASATTELPDQGVRISFVGQVELLEPFGADSPVRRFLERRGPGLHHLAYRVPDIVSAMERARQQGFELIDTEPRPGAHGHLVAFLHPRATGGSLIELVEIPGKHV